MPRIRTGTALFSLRLAQYANFFPVPSSTIRPLWQSARSWRGSTVDLDPSIRAERNRGGCWRFPHVRPAEWRRGRLLGEKRQRTAGHRKRGSYWNTSWPKPPAGGALSRLPHPRNWPFLCPLGTSFQGRVMENLKNMQIFRSWPIVRFHRFIRISL
jgi:hypothetical protein